LPPSEHCVGASLSIERLIRPATFPFFLKILAAFAAMIIGFPDKETDRVEIDPKDIREPGKGE
jgi:hypothetical protein